MWLQNTLSLILVEVKAAFWGGRQHEDENLSNVYSHYVS